MDTIEQIFFNTINKYQMLSPNDKVLVAVSGGFDSTALLHILNLHKKELGIKLHIAHLNHRLRGKESDQDELYVLQLAKRLGLPITTEHYLIQDFAKKEGLSIEDAARRIRYDFLKRTAIEVSANKIAIAHTSDDQAETILFRIIRGTGIKGLSSIPPVRRIPLESPLTPLNKGGIQGGISIIRPFIEISREQIEHYLRKHKLRPRFDESNNDLNFARNRIRHKLLPLISSEFNSKIISNLTRLSQIASLYNEYIAEDINVAIKESVLQRDDNKWIFDKDKFLSCRKLIKYEILRECFKSLSKDSEGFSYRNVESAIKFIDEGRSGTKIQMPCGIEILKEQKTFIVSISSPSHILLNESISILDVPGELSIPTLNISIKSELYNIEDIIDEFKNFKSNYDKHFAYFDYDKLELPLIVRTRRKGDTMQLLGMNEEKRLKRIMIDLKIPISKRKKIPLLLSGDKMLWIIGYRTSEMAKITDETKRVVVVKWTDF